MQLDMHFPTVSQFEHGESAYECGFFTVALLTALGQHAPLLTAEQVDQLADRLYEQVDGPNTRSNTNGMSLDAWYHCLREEKIQFAGIGTGVQEIAGALEQGQPVAVTVDESSVVDLDLRNPVPYAWPPSGTHIITIIGQDASAWLCLDSANIGPDGVRSWPRRYSQKKLSVHLATAITLPWTVSASPPPPARTTYIIRPGDCLGEIAQNHGIWPPSVLYVANQDVLEQDARAHGFRNSENGRWIFPGTRLVIPG